MAINEDMISRLLRPAETAAESVGARWTEAVPKEGFLKGAGLKGAGASLLGYLIMNRLMQVPGEYAERGVRKEALRAQAGAMTPESLYYQAAMPQAQAEESQARQALFAHISGGVLGPTLARGERLLGG